MSQQLRSLSTITLFLIFFTLSGNLLHAESGDRQIPMHIVYPPKAFKENGGCVIDMTKPPYNAKGDGVTDNTAAFRAMMNFLSDELAAARKSGIRQSKWTIYLPTGTYLVSDTITYTNTTCDASGGFCGLRLIGEDRAKTIIKLKDKSPGFEAGAKKNLVEWYHPEKIQAGIAWGNQVRNLTIHTGSGNPGAVGILFLGANTCTMDNMNFISGDGQGYAGLRLEVGSVQGVFSDMTIKGFDYGVTAERMGENQPGLEYITLSGQKRAGIWVESAAVSMRKLNSVNAVPAVITRGTGAQTVILDSTLKGTGSGPAIVHHKTAAGAATLHAGFTGRTGRNVGVGAVDNLITTVQPAGGAEKEVLRETFDSNSTSHDAASFNENFTTNKTSGNSWNHANSGGVSGGCMTAPGGQVTTAIHKTPFPGFQTGTKIRMKFDARMGGHSTAGFGVNTNVYLKDLSEVDGIPGLNIEIKYPANRTTNKFDIVANGETLETIDFDSSVKANSAWWYRWEAIWTRLPDGSYDLSLQLFDLGKDGLTAPMLFKSWTRKAFKVADKSYLFARNIDVSGSYTCAIESDTKPVVKGNVSEYNSGSVIKFNDATPSKSMNLSVEEVALVPWESNPANWACTSDFQGTDSERLRAALNSGKPAVMVTERINAPGTYKIPSTVKQIDFMSYKHQTQTKVFKFEIAEESTQPLWIENVDGLNVEVNAPRPLHFRYSAIGVTVNTPLPVVIHMQNCYNWSDAPAKFCPPNAKFYCRSINQENWGASNWVINGGIMWVMGFKTEAAYTCFDVKNGGFLEVLGGYQNWGGKGEVGRPTIENNNSNVSYMGTTFMTRHITNGIWETRGTTQHKILNANLPKRFFYTTVTTPLYVGYDPSKMVLPVISPPPGSYGVDQKVSISYPWASGVAIRYTLDGSTPSETNGTAYTTPIMVKDGANLQAVAYKTGMTTSKPIGGSYAIGHMPDLVVTAVTWNPANPVTGDEVSFSATIKNQSKNPTPPGVEIGCEFQINGTKLCAGNNGKEVSIPENGSITVNGTIATGGKTTWLALPGTYTVKVIADDVNRLPENDETNNTLTATLNPGKGEWTTWDQNDKNVTYSGTKWHSNQKFPGAYNDNDSSSATKDSYLQFTFTGTQAKLYGVKGNWSGMVNIYVDNMTTPVATVDTYNRFSQNKALIYDTGKLSAGPHTIRWEPAEKKNPAAAGNWVEIDFVNWKN